MGIYTGSSRLGRGGSIGRLMDAAVFIWNTTGINTWTVSQNAIVHSLLTGTASLKKMGSGVLTLTNKSTFSGGVVVNAGTLNLVHDSSDGYPAIQGNITLSNLVNTTRPRLLLSYNNQLQASAKVTQSISVNNTVYTDFALGGCQQTISDYSSVISLGNGNNFIQNGLDISHNATSGVLTFDNTNTITLGSGSTNKLIIRDNFGTLSLVKDGTGILSFNLYSASYTGGFTMRNGTVHIAGTAFSDTGVALTSTPITLIGGTFSSSDTTARSLGVGNTVSLSGDITLGDVANNGKLTFGGPATLFGNRNLTVYSAVEFSGPIGEGYAGASMTKSGTGTLILSGANTYTGTTTIASGTLQVGSGADSGSIAYSSSIVNNGALVYNTGTGSRTYANVISGSGSLTQNSSGGTLTLSGQNTYTGTTTISAGKIVLGNSLALQNSAYDTTGSTGAVGLDLGVYTTPTLGGIIGSINLATAMTGYGNVTSITLNTQSGLVHTYSGVISNGAVSTSLTKTGTGEQILSGSNTFSGGLYISAGSIKIGNTGALNSTAGSENAVSFGSATTGVLTLNGNNIVISNLNGTASGPIIKNDMSGSVSITIGNSQNLSGSYAGTLQNGSIGSLAVVKSGIGTLTLNGYSANTFTGGLTISGGTLKLDYSNYNGDQLINSGNSITFSGSSLTIQGNNTSGAANVQTFSGTTINAGSNTINIAKGLSGSSVSLNLGQVTINTGAVLFFYPTSSWTTTASTTEIVKVTSGGSITVPVSGTSFVGATCMYGTGNATRWAQVNSSGQLLAGPVSTNLAATSNSVTTLNNVNSSDITFTTTTASSYGLILNTSVTKTITTAANGVYTLNGIIGIGTGQVNIVAGTSGRLQIGPEKTLVINLATTGPLSISAPIINNGANVSGLIVNSTGSGVVILSGVNTYTGATSVTKGVLRVNGSISSATTIYTGGSICGTGTISSNLSANTGGIIYGGTGSGNAGTLSVTGDVSLSSGSSLNINIGSSTTTSRVAITGNLTLNANAVTFQSAALNAGTYTLFTYTGSQSGTLATPTLTGTGRTFGGYSYSGGSVTITLT